MWVYFLKKFNFLTVWSKMAYHLLADIDESLQMYQDQIKTEFSRKWSTHKCEKPGKDNFLEQLYIKYIFLELPFIFYQWKIVLLLNYLYYIRLSESIGHRRGS